MKKEKDIDPGNTIIPDWHIEIIKARLTDYKRNPANFLDFDEAMDDIEKEL